ncbi:hypothetical protein ACEQ8H_000368 [Pleosporales sp. CAS-2024a]
MQLPDGAVCIEPVARREYERKYGKINRPEKWWPEKLEAGGPAAVPRGAVQKRQSDRAAEERHGYDYDSRRNMQVQLPGSSMARSDSVWSQQPQRSSWHGMSRVRAHDFASRIAGHAAFPPRRAQPQARQYQAPPPPRTGKVREGDRLPTGRVDPLATATPQQPLGHHGMRQHVPGMTKLNPERHGKADDPMANFKVLEELADLEHGRGKENRSHKKGRRRTG